MRFTTSSGLHPNHYRNIISLFILWYCICGFLASKGKINRLGTLGLHGLIVCT
jgi:hypothetical protein